jgi:hypothetical protein
MGDHGKPTGIGTGTCTCTHVCKPCHLVFPTCCSHHAGAHNSSTHAHAHTTVTPWWHTCEALPRTLLQVKLGIGGTSYTDFINDMHLPLQLAEVDPIVASFCGGAVGVVSALLVVEVSSRVPGAGCCAVCLSTIAAELAWSAGGCARRGVVRPLLLVAVGQTICSRADHPGC